MYIRKTNFRSHSIVGFEAFLLCENAPKWQRNIGTDRSQMGAMAQVERKGKNRSGDIDVATMQHSLGSPLLRCIAGAYGLLFLIIRSREQGMFHISSGRFQYSDFIIRCYFILNQFFIILGRI